MIELIDLFFQIVPVKMYVKSCSNRKKVANRLKLLNEINVNVLFEPIDVPKTR